MKLKKLYALPLCLIVSSLVAPGFAQSGRSKFDFDNYLAKQRGLPELSSLP